MCIWACTSARRRAIMNVGLPSTPKGGFTLPGFWLGSWQSARSVAGGGRLASFPELGGGRPGAAVNRRLSIAVFPFFPPHFPPGFSLSFFRVFLGRLACLFCRV